MNSYLSGRHQRVAIEIRYHSTYLWCGMPQSSFLGPPLYIIYMCCINTVMILVQYLTNHCFKLNAANSSDLFSGKSNLCELAEQRLKIMLNGEILHSSKCA